MTKIEHENQEPFEVPELIGKLVTRKSIRRRRPMPSKVWDEAPCAMVFVAEFEPVERVLYVEFLIGETTINREFNSVSQFWRFFNEFKK